MKTIRICAVNHRSIEKELTDEVICKYPYIIVRPSDFKDGIIYIFELNKIHQPIDYIEYTIVNYATDPIIHKSKIIFGKHIICRRDNIGEKIVLFSTATQFSNYMIKHKWSKHWVIARLMY